MTTRPTSFRRRAITGAAALSCSVASLTACSSASDNPAAITADEDRQLNAAAAQLDATTNAAPPDTNESPAP